MRTAAALSLGAAFIHASVVVVHFEELWLYGGFFLGVTVLQAAWAGAVWPGRPTRRTLWAGVAGNAVLIVLWATSRVVGPPFGSQAGEPEQIGVHDALASCSELALVALVLGYSLRRSDAPRWMIIGGWMLAGAAALSSLVAQHTHSG